MSEVDQIISAIAQLNILLYNLRYITISSASEPDAQMEVIAKINAAEYELSSFRRKLWAITLSRTNHCYI